MPVQTPVEGIWEFDFGGGKPGTLTISFARARRA